MSSEDLSFLSGGQGMEHLQAGDTKTPFLKIAQKGSPEVDKDKKEFIMGLEPGQIFHSITGDIFGEKMVLTILNWQHVWNEWADKQFAGVHQPNDPKIRAILDTADFSKWLRTDNGNQISDSYNFMVLVEGWEALGPGVLSFRGSGIGDAKRLLADLNMAKAPDGNKANVFAHKWEFSTERNENDDGVWWRFGKGKASNMKPLGFITAAYYTEHVKRNVEIAQTLKVIPQLEDGAAASPGARSDL